MPTGDLCTLINHSVHGLADLFGRVRDGSPCRFRLIESKLHAMVVIVGTPALGFPALRFVATLADV
ncbi:hypothetical protein LX32DRAFT_697067 [Colletotrichum zoysiae]|uniref:Uncharacterized protein n=1 Tax=Colletotrichum zoysiae TaxID=1216348 RepID=A0AAD9M0F3_9PEZI|nr:hypothetical protein LX32DRAFT_697067 [Colletotrichum zoysiae]